MSESAFRLTVVFLLAIAALSLYGMANMVAAAWLERSLPSIIPVRASET